jgi:hypothetical protein
MDCLKNWFCNWRPSLKTGGDGIIDPRMNVRLFLAILGASWRLGGCIFRRDGALTFKQFLRMGIL